MVSKELEIHSNTLMTLILVSLMSVYTMIHSNVPRTYLLGVEKCFDGGDIIKVVFEGEHSVDKPPPELASSMLTSRLVGIDSGRQIEATIVDVRLFPL